MVTPHEIKTKIPLISSSCTSFGILKSNIGTIDKILVYKAVIRSVWSDDILIWRLKYFKYPFIKV